MAAPAVPSLSLNSGQDIPVIGLGTFNNLKQSREIYDAVKVAIDEGYRHIDCAWVYRSEGEIGDAIADKIKEGAVTREELFVTSKLWNFFHEPNKVEPACRESLSALKLDYVDLYLIHWPMAFEEPEDRSQWVMSPDIKPATVDIVDTWRAMENLVDAGLARAIGVSNFNQNQLTRILQAPGLRIKPAVNQFEIHPYLSNSDLVAFCQKSGIVVTAYSPLIKSGTLYAGKPTPNIYENPVIQAVAVKHRKTPAQVALRWGVQRGYSLVPKSVTPARIRENIQIFDFELNEEDMKAINAVNSNQRVILFPQFKDFPGYPF